MKFERMFESSRFLMEGALGERLKREYCLLPDGVVALASHVYSAEGRAALTELWQGYLAIAQRYSLPFIATTPTRRVNKERVAVSRYSESIAEENVSFLRNICDSSKTPAFAGALIGCKGDACSAADSLTESEAQRFHAWTIERFAKADVDFFFAGIMPALPEVAGMAKALSESHIPYIISFMMRDDGCLMDGTTIHDAISYIDDHTINQPLGYMTNCIHPQILHRTLSFDFNATDVVRSRFIGIQANTSPLSPEELNNSKILHVSNPNDLAAELFRLKELIELKIIGGCCGTDEAYMEAIAREFQV